MATDTLGPPFSTRRMRAGDWSEMQFFKPNDFKRPDLMGYEFVKWLDALRAKCGFPIKVTSDARTAAHNKEVGGASNSAHVIDENNPAESCNAIDIGKLPRDDDPNWNLSRWLIVTNAIILGCVRIGIYPNGSLHLDRTENERAAPRLWIQVDNPA